MFCTVSKKSYLTAISKFNLPEMNVVWRSEEKQLKWKDVPNDLSFLPDFIEMVQTRYLLRANSTFSFWASFFNTIGKVYSPLVENRIGECDVEFIEGNWPKIGGRTPDIIFGR